MSATVLYLPLWNPDSDKSVRIGCVYCGHPALGLFIGMGWRFVVHVHGPGTCASANPGVRWRFELDPNTPVRWLRGRSPRARLGSATPADEYGQASRGADGTGDQPVGADGGAVDPDQWIDDALTEALAVA